MINKLRKYQMGSFLDIFEYFTQKNWAGIILRYNIFDNFIAKKCRPKVLKYQKNKSNVRSQIFEHFWTFAPNMNFLAG